MGVRTDEPQPGEALHNESEPPELCISDDEDEDVKPSPPRERRNLKAATLQMPKEIEDIIKDMLEETTTQIEDREILEWRERARAQYQEYQDNLDNNRAAITPAELHQDITPAVLHQDITPAELHQDIAPAEFHQDTVGNDDNLVAPMSWAPSDEDLILATEEELEIEVAADTGCVAHVAGPDSIPNSIQVEKPADGSEPRNFIGAGGDMINNYGKAHVSLVQGDGKEISNIFHVADVCRPLHSVSTICDNGHEMLFTNGVGVVVPAGALSQFLGQVRQVAKYPRSGGLYVSKMKVRKPKPSGPKDTGFGRPGAK